MRTSAFEAAWLPVGGAARMRGCALLMLGYSLLMLGCAMTSKGDPLTPRFFSVAAPRESVAPGERREVRAEPFELRLGNVAAAAYLEERFVYRVSETELGYREDRRWTESPEAFLRRALAHELFEVQGLRRVVSGAAPTLEVELTSFDELTFGQRRARLAVHVVLEDERNALLEREIVVEEPVGSESGSELPDAMSRALRRAVHEVALGVFDTLASVPNATAPSAHAAE